jgi:hypothetical protein
MQKNDKLVQDLSKVESLAAERLRTIQSLEDRIASESKNYSEKMEIQTRVRLDFFFFCFSFWRPLMTYSIASRSAPSFFFFLVAQALEEAEKRHASELQALQSKVKLLEMEKEQDKLRMRGLTEEVCFFSIFLHPTWGHLFWSAALM